MYKPEKFPNNDFRLTRCVTVRDLRQRYSGVAAPDSAFSGDNSLSSALPSSKIDQYDAALRDYDNRLRDEYEQERANTVQSQD